MGLSSMDQTQRRAARAVGITYILTNALAYFAEFHVRARLIDYGSAAKTAENILSSEHLFRLGLAADLLTFAGDVVIIVGSYLILRSACKGLAIFGLAWRLVETAIVAVMTINTFDVLRFLSGAAYLKAFSPDQLDGLVSMAFGVHDAGYNVAFLFFGLGSGAFCLAWYRSRYIPRVLAAWGILGSILAAASTLVYTLSPALARIVEPTCFVPIGTFELFAGFWLSLRGLPRSTDSTASATGA